MKIDMKKLITSNGLGKNILAAARGLLDDNVKEFTIVAGNGNTQVENAKGTLRLNLDLDVEIGDVQGHINLGDVQVILH